MPPALEPRAVLRRAPGLRDIASGSPTSLIWTNHAWKAAPLATIHGTAPNLRHLSCGSATNCMAIGSYGNPAQPVAEHWNGIRWQLTQPVNH